MTRRLRLPRPWNVLVIAGLALLPGFVPKLAEAQTAVDAVPHITIVGHAHLDVVPDIATLSVAVATERPKASDAIAANSEAAQALIDQVKTQGVDTKDIKTVSITLDPVYDQQRDPDSHTTKRVLRGYRARNGFAIKVHDIAKAGRIARQLIDNGANEFYGIDFGYEHKDQVYDKLRAQAVQDALHKAKAYLPGLNLKLGRVLEIMPEPDAPMPRGKMFAAAMPAGPSESTIPIEPGTQTLQMEVRVSWEIDPTGKP